MSHYVRKAREICSSLRQLHFDKDGASASINALSSQWLFFLPSYDSVRILLINFHIILNTHLVTPS